MSSRFGALSVPNYRVFFAGSSITMSGYWLMRTAQSWLAIEITGSPAALGLMQVVQFLPVTMLSLFAGVLLDRLPMRWVMAVAQLVVGLACGVTALLVFSGAIQFWHLLVFAAILGIASAFDSPSRSAFANELVGPREVGSAIALNSALNNGARIVGPGLGGVMIALWGNGVCFAIGALSCLGAVASLVLLHRDQLFPKRQAGRGNVLSQLWDGIRYSFSTPTLGFQMVVMAFIGTFAFNWGLVLPLLARFGLNAGSEGFGLLNMALGIGAVVGGLTLTSRLQPSIRLVLVTASLFSILVFLVGIAPDMPTAVLVVVLCGALSLGYSATANTLLQLEAEERYRGRVVSLYMLLWSGSTPIGGALIGWLSDQWSIRLAMEVSGVMSLVGVFAGAAYLALARRRQLSPHRLGELQAR